MASKNASTYVSPKYLIDNNNFQTRHIGPSDEQIDSMLLKLGYKSLDEFSQAVVPKAIQASGSLDLPEALSEANFLKQTKKLAQKNKLYRNFIGQGYYGTYTPTVIQRNILENPGWYTAYTPYQAEISQGRMEALLNFQTMVMELTGMELSNASLLDEGTAIAEAVAMAKAVNRKSKSNKVFVDKDVFAQSLDVLQTRMNSIGIDVVVADLQDSDLGTADYFAAVIQYPSASGEIPDVEAFIEKSRQSSALSIFSTDLLSLALLKPPGEFGADIVVGSTQRFGVPMGFGGPHAAFLATRDAYKRSVPGRIIGVSKDTEDQPALRLALQTREQHIRREKATSNICTAQVLLAVMAGMYAVYHGPAGLRKIAGRTHHMTSTLKTLLEGLGLKTVNKQFFDTLSFLKSDFDLAALKKRSDAKQINLGELDDRILVSLDETTTLEDLADLVEVLTSKKAADVQNTFENSDIQVTEAYLRKSDILTHPIFRQHHSETELLRYMHQLEGKDLSLNQSMIPLGSCTMKLNATSEMMPVTWPEFSQIHPFAPADQTEGYRQLISSLESWLSTITGFSAVSNQPNAGSQGEFAGLLAIKKYFEANGESHRNVCLIPSSAHGTNPASAVMAGMRVVVVGCDDQGNIDVEDLVTKADANKDNLAALMVTYPSTHGVFEESIKEICQVIHDCGGQVYMDGANLNALVGLAKPAEFGADVCHMNLHKTFCIPHGGGGPGVGPIGVAEHLKPFLPGHALDKTVGGEQATGAISAAPFGSASILPISYAYIAMMGPQGLKKASQVAILNANYMAKRLEPHFQILYRGQNGLVAHECIVDVRPFRDSADVTVDDIAKRLMDFGFHAPTMSWPVAGTLMIEPTESESQAELDRYCDALIAIREEIRLIEQEKWPKDINPLKMAPHTLKAITSESWDRPYTREQAVYPLEWVKTNKFWTSVARVDNAFGDRNLVCSCPPIEDFIES